MTDEESELCLLCGTRHSLEKLEYLCFICALKANNKIWISVKDKLPENGVKVLVLHHKDKFEWLRTDRIAIGYLGMDCNDVFIVGESPRHIDDKHNHITHWMPLPEPPNE